MTLDYFYGQAGELFSFYRIPKALFQEPRFQSLSTDAKTLYGILLDRMSLSVKNGWLDEQNRVFIIFTIEDVKRALCCADNKATKLLRELEKFGLIERKRRGLGKPSLVYVKNFSAESSRSIFQNRDFHDSGGFKNASQTSMNFTTTHIRSEKVTIDTRIYTILNGRKKPGEVYLAAIAPDMELTIITLDEAPGILPCFEEDDACLNLPNTSLLLCYNPAQVLKMGGKHYLTGPVILVRTNMDGEVISLTIDEVYLFQKYLASHSITLMADDQKLPCICME